MNNPYITGRPVRDPENFYGRKKEVNEIFSLIKKQQPISLIGQRRTGRTSLLHYITHPDIVAEYLDPEIYTLLYLDFEGVSELSQTQFWKLILLKMKNPSKDSEKSLINNLSKKEKIIITDIYELVEEYSNQNSRIVFCFDEFESITQNTNFSSAFFNNLRYLISSYPNVTYVTVTWKSLKDLTHSKETKASPFFNIFHEMRIGFLKGEDIEHMVFEPSEREGVKFNEDDKDFVFDVAYCHPFFAQLACYEIFKRRCDKEKTSGEKLDQASYDTLKGILYGNFKNHFDYYWKKLRNKEQKILKELCNSSGKEYKEDNLVETLKNLCLIKEDNGKYTHFSSIFHRFCNEVDYYEPPFGSDEND